MAQNRVNNVLRTPPAHSGPKPIPPPPQLRRSGPANTEGKTRQQDQTSALVLELRNGEELLFQFDGRQGWPMAEQLGTVSIVQAILARKKIAKLGRLRKPTRVNMEYKLWGTGSDGDSEDGEEALREEQEEGPQSSSGAHPSNESSIAGSSGSATSGHSEADGSVWEMHTPDFDDYEGGDALSRGNARFWTFRREDVREQQAESEDRSYSSSSGWTVLEPSRSEPLAVALEAVDSNGVAEQESNEIQLQGEGPSEDTARLAWEDRSSLEDNTLNGAAAASAGPLSDVELRHSPASSSGQQYESADNKTKRSAGQAGALAAILKSLSNAASHFFQGWLGALRQGLRSVQAACCACLFFCRAAWWAIKGRPRPPQSHASPMLARLRACNNVEAARQFSLSAGFDRDGKTEAPLADLPRWRVEALVGTYVCDMRLYRRALTTPMAVEDAVDASYERLEYVGDAVLGLIIREYIYKKYPGVTEHAMCTMVSGLVSGRTLHDFARGLRLEHYLALNANDQYTMRGMSGYAGGVLADAFEALLGALFMDRGYPAARAFLLRLIEDVVDMERLPLNRDYKGILGNITRLRRLGRALYKSRAVMGTLDPERSYPLVPDAPGSAGTSLIWVCDVTVGGIVATGADIHRTTAEQQAARAALQALGMPLDELSLVEADQLTMLDMANLLPNIPAAYPVSTGNGGYAENRSGNGTSSDDNGSTWAGGKAPRGQPARRA
ncbi:probable ribonuclease 3 at C-terminar half [Coccomyxa sp. Obi]|nr:probable ribonuclease 3 at C-terminar half [Coccomyxa sp. Obi]